MDEEPPAVITAGRDLHSAVPAQIIGVVWCRTHPRRQFQYANWRSGAGGRKAPHNSAIFL
jgi:hypothetical protein